MAVSVEIVFLLVAVRLISIYEMFYNEHISVNIKATVYQHEYRQWLMEGTDVTVKIAFTNVNIH